MKFPKKKTTDTKNTVKSFFKKLLYPPKPVLIIVPIIGFAGTIYVLAGGCDKSILAYIVYAAAAYSLLILTLGIIKVGRNFSKMLNDESGESKKSITVRFLQRYRRDMRFKLELSLLCGLIADIIYAVFGMITGIAASSVWFITTAVYYALLSASRLYLLICCGKTRKVTERYDIHYENTVYKRSAVFLLVINIASGGIVYLTITGGRPFNYPYHLIYASALYSFVSVGFAIANLIRYSKTGSPIAFAAKITSLIAACSSLYGLQAALLNAFYSGANGFDVTMNRLTGVFVYLFTTGTAIYMLIRMRKKGTKEIKSD